jgi:ankyrin repeat protein
MTYISKNSDIDYPYDFYIPLPKDINQPFPTKLDGIPFNWTLLHCAAYNGHKGLVNHLIGLGADKEGKDDYFGSTPLIWAAYNGQYDTCEMLIENHAANTKAQNTYGQYPLDIAPDNSDAKWIKLFNSKKKPKPRKNETSSKGSRENSGTPQDTPKTKQSKDSDTFQSEDKNSNIPDFSGFSIEEPSATHFVAILTRNSNAMKAFLKEFLDFAEESGLRDIVKSLNELPNFVRPHILNPDLTNEDDVKLKSYLEVVRSPVDINMIMNLNRTIRNFDFLDFQINLIFENAIKSAQIIPEYNADDIPKLKDLYEKYRDKFRNTGPGKDIPTINDHRSVTDYISVSIRGVLYGLNDFVLIRDNDYINPIIIQIIKITKNG